MIKMEILSASVLFKTVRQNYVSRGSSQADLTCFFTNLFLFNLVLFWQTKKLVIPIEFR